MTETTPSNPPSIEPINEKEIEAADGDPRLALMRSVAQASIMVEQMLQVIRQDITYTGSGVGSASYIKKAEQDGMMKKLSGPSGAITSLYRLMQVLDKVRNQLEKDDEEKTAETQVTLSHEDLAFLKQWLEQSQ